MGNVNLLQSTFQKIGFEDIQYAIKNPENFLLINTLSEKEQNCLIPNTILAEQEEGIINRLLQKGKKDIYIIIYGKNTNDENIYKKYNQLIRYSDDYIDFEAFDNEKGTKNEYIIPNIFHYLI